MEEHRRFEDLWNEMGASAWYEIWLAKLDEVRAGFGQTIGAAPETIGLMPSVSAGVAAVWAAVAASPQMAKRRKVVLTELDFPTVGHHFLSQRATGLEVEIVSSPDGIQVPLEAIAEAVDENTALLVTSHVLFTSGTIQDASELSRIAHESGAVILLDAYQSNGQLEMDVRGLDVDFLVAGALKWLCGGPGMAYLYLDSGVRVDPVTLSWFGVENQFEFDIRGASPRSDARRFELGTPATGAAYTAAGGLSLVLETGMGEIERRNRRLAEDLRARLAEAGHTLHQSSDPAARSGLVLIEHADAAEAVRGLAERDVIVDHRGPLLRFSPHFYNTIEDNERAMRALAEVLGGGTGPAATPTSRMEGSGGKVRPDDQRLAPLREIIAWVRKQEALTNAGEVEGEGAGEDAEPGGGFAALFSGPSGTGKTMAAEMLARELDRDLVRIDLSAMVSKYIGETEKNLVRVFEAAERAGAILFFDEADALFGRRGEVRDSHDRYANLETDFLLQRLEAHGGLVVLTSNRSSTLDPAFVRRFAFVLEFSLPPDEKD